MKKSLLALSLLVATVASASPSASPPPPPSTGSSSAPARHDALEVTFFNDGTVMLFKKQWAAAQQQFEAALAINEKMAEAHNNLAYVLRKQGQDRYAASLQHYNRAIELKPKMAEAYMYRGALYALSGKAGLAQADYDMLVRMKSKLAPHLKKVIDTGTEEEPEQFYGVSKKQ
ncbi:tetratricopeptide repeat protein [Opitutus sp. GAS368]|uniref:tetratricopeptide repeat protein n=1 Tax=Opitutus sp. GAS368 TaxID=1882749 RepID=UPI00087DBB2D|nr:tetratricopeptide repeat protein [Opitutus sp. GAS368]SDR66268.1 TPR repeat-containing protein [Opitutus sp. GAS368]